jgi:hypothetical protein
MTQNEKTLYLSHNGMIEILPSRFSEIGGRNLKPIKEKKPFKKG